jgi:hypothetical protein
LGKGLVVKDRRNKERKISSETKTRDEKIRDVKIHKDRFVSDCFMLASCCAFPKTCTVHVGQQLLQAKKKRRREVEYTQT